MNASKPTTPVDEAMVKLAAMSVTRVLIECSKSGVAHPYIATGALQAVAAYCAGNQLDVTRDAVAHEKLRRHLHKIIDTALDKSVEIWRCAVRGGPQILLRVLRGEQLEDILKSMVPPAAQAQAPVESEVKP